MNSKSLILFLSASTLISCSLPSAASTSPQTISSGTYTLLQAAYDQMRKSHFELATKTLSRAIRADRDCMTARRYLSYALLQQGDAGAALGQLNLIPDPGAFDLFLKGVAAEMLGQVRQSADYFLQSVNKDPQNDYYRSKAIMSYINLSNYQKASVLSADGTKLAVNPQQKQYYEKQWAHTQELAAAVASNRPCNH